MRAVILLLALGCGGDDSVPQPSPGLEDTSVPAMEDLFSFVVLADPHLTDAALEHQERLSAAVEWVNSQPDVELVVVVGDIGWNGGLPIAKALLDGLTMPYVPIIGDNEVHIGAEKTFDEVFSEQYALLATVVDDFERGEVEVQNPEWGVTSWLQNLSFEYRGIRFLGLDWCSRNMDGILGEMAALHDFDGGTFPWFSDQIGAIEAGADENVLLFSHHPMYMSPGAFNIDDMARISDVTRPLEDRIAAAWAGHYHLSWDEDVPSAGYSIHITDATWDDENTARVVRVRGNGERFVYEQELVIIPP
jgi:hypothetical protein